MSNASFRVAVVQYPMRPISSFAGFAGQVSDLVGAAAGSQARLVVLPEYATLQLASIDAGHLDGPDLVRRVAGWLPEYLEVFTGLAAQHDLYIVGGTIPTVEEDRVYNDAYLFSPDGAHGVQGKLHPTPYEREGWGVRSRSGLTVFETRWGRLGIATCYDIEFPEVARALARNGVQMLAVPSCTESRAGFYRVRHCAQARAVENQVYVFHAPTVGQLAGVGEAYLHVGEAAVLSPCDVGFPADGVVARGTPDQPGLVVGEVELERLQAHRLTGTVRTLFDSLETPARCQPIQCVTL